MRPRQILAWVLALVALLPGLAAAAPPPHWGRLSENGRRTIELRRAVRGMQKVGAIQTAHPAVAQRLSEDLSQSLGRAVSIPARRIVQVEWGSAEHQALRAVLKSSIGVGIYPSRTWGHSKLRLGDLVADAVPAGSAPFPSTGTRARIVPMDGMHARYYEAVFAADPAALVGAVANARSLVAEKCTTGMSCASFVSKILREHLASGSNQPGALEALRTSESAAGSLWKKAVGAQPALVIVYTPRGDYRSVSHEGFRFDYSLK